MMGTPLDEKGHDASTQALLNAFPMADKIAAMYAEVAIRAYLSATALPDGMEVVASKPWPLGGYAPGNYTCMCLTCKASFIGDKRAHQCLPCAASQAQSALAAMRAKDAQRLDHIKKLERRIHNQRRSNRDTWEIIEARNKWLGAPEARKAFARLLVRHRATEAEVKRLTEDNEALRAALRRICENASRRDLHGNGALHDLVMPYLIDEARQALGSKE